MVTKSYLVNFASCFDNYFYIVPKLGSLLATKISINSIIIILQSMIVTNGVIKWNWKSGLEFWAAYHYRRYTRAVEKNKGD